MTRDQIEKLTYPFKFISPFLLLCLTTSFGVFGYFYKANEASKGIILTQSFKHLEDGQNETKGLILRLEEKVDANQTFSISAFHERDLKAESLSQDTWLWRSSMEHRITSLEAQKFKTE